MGFTTKKISLIALMSALTAVLTLAAIPLPGGGYYNFGDAVVFVSAATLGPVSGAFVGGLGGALGDLVLGYTFYAPFTLVIKAAEALVTGLVFRALKRLFRDKGGRAAKCAFCALAGIAGGLVMAAGYFLAEGLLLSEGGWQGGLVNLPWNILQGVASAFVAAVVAVPFRTDLLISRVLLPRDKRGKDEDGEKSDGEKGGDGDESAIN